MYMIHTKIKKNDRVEICLISKDGFFYGARGIVKFDWAKMSLNKVDIELDSGIKIDFYDKDKCKKVK